MTQEIGHLFFFMSSSDSAATRKHTMVGQNFFFWGG